MRRVETQSIRDVATGSIARLSHQATSSPAPVDNSRLNASRQDEPPLLASGPNSRARHQAQTDPGPHLVYGLLTTAPNAILEPIHDWFYIEGRPENNDEPAET